MSGALWSRFNKLVANPPRQIASVIAVDDMTVTVQYLGGSVADMPANTVKAGDSYRVGQKVFIQGNELKGSAPDLVYFEAVV